MGPSVDALLDEGFAALRAGDATAARRAFDAASADRRSGVVLEGLGRVSYLELDFARAIELLEDAYAAYRGEGDLASAVRMARSVGYLHGTINGDFAVTSGWMARARSLLAGHEDSVEAGWIALNTGMFEPDRAEKERQFRHALDLARRHGDGGLELVTLAYLGASLVHDDRSDEGMRLLDEALAAVAGGEIDDFSLLEEIFCQLFSACEHARDVSRADQWMRIGETMAVRRNLPAVSAYCRTHYGGILTAAGRWPEADAALSAAVRLWDLSERSGMRAGALVRLAELRVRQGRFEEAEQLLDGLEASVESAHPLAAIHLHRGEAAMAWDVLQRALDQMDPSSAAAVPLLALLVDVQLAAGAVDEARLTVDRLAECTARSPRAYLRAATALARGRVCLAAGDGDPAACLREALAGFADAQLPMELARARLALAGALVDQRPEVAMIEARAALDAFGQLQAARAADEAAALLRTLGAHPAVARQGAGVLTKREAEVLELLGLGLSNPEISDRLFISRKTVEHHVGNILAKLGLRSRAEAAAYATRSKPASG